MARLLQKIKNIKKTLSTPRHPPPPPFTLHSHDAAALIEQHLAWLELPARQWDPRRAAALNSLGAWLRQHEWLDAIGSVPSIDSMEELFEIFDDLFFASSLRDNYIFRWMNGGRHCAGLTFTPPGSPMTTIAVNWFLVRWGSFGTIECIVSVLLHEMCHAYMLVWGCMGKKSGCSRWACQKGSERYVKEIGMGGHGDAWQRLALTVELLAGDMGLVVDLLVEKTVRLDR
ncbi:hypothetical protein CLAFUW4_04176 [Fulvia fulva]|uniref:SprT-like domain-containing protein n=1 Tax=Passalora fulva TaxID=5499 RepID=A0A9Q8LGI8_PASFU|nr:uncharacterized protein CLAFUR5_04139 [Fulvia fulva]KAK4626476.1 hypothetical protein CLAFUR4_04162 [Fulvia fulva]KAK4627718.1 hypothetical protein CLAFUR0_04163 [Fulvia fulva]UJO16208.1 hypothetical protein CLAFUR5_04139 [Fulvia fulva]WPV14020.1 hypothetical protein CLAFUW4_04176 [Fulvia fulva]WPV28644.1 hypothetical protein CLAFUW7_04165 [Fulvia fulva]